jgi:hypothetical protein
MKRHLITFAVAMAMTCAGAASAYAQDNDGCSNATLQGDYGFTIAGNILNPDGTVTTRNGVAMTRFDGNGNLTQVDYTMSLTPGSKTPGGFDPAPAFRQGETGTYHVNSDCTGTAEIDFPKPKTPPGAPPFATGPTLKLIFVLSNHGRVIHTVVTELLSPGISGPGAPIPAVIHSDGWKLGYISYDNN